MDADDLGTDVHRLQAVHLRPMRRSVVPTVTVTPIRAAKLTNARRTLTELLTGRCPHPDQAARDAIDALQALGWTPPGWADDEPLPQPASSDRAHRRRVITEALAVADAKRRDRTTVKESTDG